MRRERQAEWTQGDMQDHLQLSKISKSYLGNITFCFLDIDAKKNTRKETTYLTAVT